MGAAGMAGFDLDQGKQGAQFLSDTWSKQVNSDVYELWDGKGLIKGCLTESACFNDDPMLNQLQAATKIFTEVKRNFTVNAANVETGDYVSFNQTNLEIDEIAQAAVSSSSIPGVFPPQHFKDMILMDGGTIWDIDILSAVNQCLNVVDDEADIIVDVAICGDNVLKSEEEVSKDSISNWQRSNYITKFYRSSNAIIEQKRAHPNVQYRHLFLEQNALANLDFRNQTTWPYQMQGREDAQKVIDNPAFDGFQTLEYWMENEKTLREKFTTFTEYYYSYLNQ